MTSIEFHGCILGIPDDHSLPQILAQQPDYRDNLARLAVAVERKYPGRGFIDFGANVGDTAAIVRAHSNIPLLCIEGSELYYSLLSKNVRSLHADVELVSRDGGHLTRLDLILARHPRFQTSKLLKIDLGDSSQSILEDALDWITTARPVLYWPQHDASDKPAAAIFERLLSIGYREALLFDSQGRFMERVSLTAHHEFIRDCDICAFHDEDLDLCMTEQSLDAQARFDRYRQQLQIADLETRVSSKDAEIHKLHLMLRDLLAELNVERTTRSQSEEISQTKIDELKAQLTGSRGETASLRHEIDTNLTLRVARSLHWILGPIRKLIGGSSNGGSG